MSFRHFFTLVILAALTCTPEAHAKKKPAAKAAARPVQSAPARVDGPSMGPKPGVYICSLHEFGGKKTYAGYVALSRSGSYTWNDSGTGHYAYTAADRKITWLTGPHQTSGWTGALSENHASKPVIVMKAKSDPRAQRERMMTCTSQN